MKISATEHESVVVSPNVEATARPISFELSISLRGAVLLSQCITGITSDGTQARKNP